MMVWNLLSESDWKRMTPRRYLTTTCFLLSLPAVALMAGCGNSEQSLPPVSEELKRSPEQEFAKLLQESEAGSAEAQIAVGLRFANGDGVETDNAKAAEWYQKAADQGSSEAHYHLGRAYDKGNGVSKDKAKAVEFYQKSADRGSVAGLGALGASYLKGEGVSKDVAKGIRLLGQAAEKGDARSQANFGVAYDLGLGVEKDHRAAVEWYKKGAAQGDSHAQTMLAYAYSEGRGLPKDEGKAVDLYKKAAAQGDSTAQGLLGWRYSDGSGVSQDSVLAYAWSNLAASDGNELATETRNRFEARLSSIEKAEAQRISSKWKKGMVLERESGPSTDVESSTGRLTKTSFGTTFLVSKAGHAITNYHVVRTCTEIRIQGRDGAAKLISEDAVNDLALLKLTDFEGDVATIAADSNKVRQGEEIVAYGFPLSSVLSSGGNLTQGVISALTGLGNNTNQIQITAPIQPGSSGSPLLNKKGEVVGVVSMKLDDAKMAKATGQLGQNVNFAVNAKTLRAFLEIQKVAFVSGAGLFSRDKSTADIADEARKWTLVVECWR